MTDCPYKCRGYRIEPALIRPLIWMDKITEIMGALKCDYEDEKNGKCHKHPDYFIHMTGFVHPILVCEEHRVYYIGVSERKSMELKEGENSKK